MTDILLVEDQQELNTLMCTFLERAGYQVKGVFSGEEALLFFRENKAKLVILDVMQNTVIGAGTYVEKAIIAENVEIGKNCKIGVGEEAPSKLSDKIYCFGIATIGENSVIPKNVTVGKNTAISGVTTESDYENGVLASGDYIVKAGDM